MLGRALVRATKSCVQSTVEPINAYAALGCAGTGLDPWRLAHTPPVRTYAVEEVADDSPREIGNEKVRAMADEILKFNLLELADLSAILKKKLGLSDAQMAPMGMGMPMMAGGMMPAAGAAAAAPAEEKKEEKTEFDVKLESFDAAGKIKLIKEIRGVTDLGLKEAKALVEKAPVLVKAKLDKKSAEEIKEKLEKVGAKVALE